MITEQDLSEAIAECEGQRNPNANTCIKLAAFYTIRDNLFPKSENKEDEAIREPKVAYSRAAGYSSDTEFGRKISTMHTEEVYAIMDELMETLSVLHPRLYAGVMRKLDSDV